MARVKKSRSAVTGAQECLPVPILVTKRLSNYYAKSRFRAVIDTEKCSGRGLCAGKRCQFEASRMRFYPEYVED